MEAFYFIAPATILGIYALLGLPILWGPVIAGTVIINVFAYAITRRK